MQRGLLTWLLCSACATALTAQDYRWSLPDDYSVLVFERSFKSSQKILAPKALVGNLESAQPIEFGPDDSLELFVSYRYTLKSLTDTLEPHGIAIENTFLNTNGEEGVFLCVLQ